MGDHPGGEEAAQRGAHRKADEHQVNHQRPTPLWGVFAHQCRGVRHGGTQPKAGKKTQQRQLVKAGSKGGQQAEATENHDGHNQNFFPPNAVGERSGGQRTDREPD